MLTSFLYLHISIINPAAEMIVTDQLLSYYQSLSKPICLLVKYLGGTANHTKCFFLLMLGALSSPWEGNWVWNDMDFLLCTTLANSVFVVIFFLTMATTQSEHRSVIRFAASGSPLLLGRASVLSTQPLCLYGGASGLRPPWWKRKLRGQPCRFAIRRSRVDGEWAARKLKILKHRSVQMSFSAAKTGVFHFHPSHW